jgi:hypothetical protein
MVVVFQPIEVQITQQRKRPIVCLFVSGQRPIACRAQNGTGRGRLFQKSAAVDHRNPHG